MFPVPLGTWDGLQSFIVAFPGPSIYLFRNLRNYTNLISLCGSAAELCFCKTCISKKQGFSCCGLTLMIHDASYSVTSFDENQTVHVTLKGSADSVN